MKISNNFRDMCVVYKIFTRSLRWNSVNGTICEYEQCTDADFSEEALRELYEFETFGKGNIDISGFNTTGKKVNGYAIGKKWLNVTVSMWMEDIDKYGWHYVRNNLYKDEKFPEWWLNKVFKDYIKNKEQRGMGFDECLNSIMEEYGANH